MFVFKKKNTFQRADERRERIPEEDARTQTEDAEADEPNGRHSSAETDEN